MSAVSERESSPAGASASPAPGALVELRNCSRWYGNVVAVNDISCRLTAGITALIGPNGAGKSTLLHMTAGLLRPSAGQVLIDGEPAAGNPRVYRKIGLVPEREAVQPFLTGFEFVRMNARLQQVRDADAAALHAIGLVDLAAAQHRPVGTYSKGMRQRIKIAAALVHAPQVLLLDEPFNGIDPRQRQHAMTLLQSLAAQGRVVLISSHILEELGDIATDMLVMVAGRLAASGHYREVRRLMTDRPNTFRIQSSDDRRLATALLAIPSVFAVELTDAGISLRTSDRRAVTRALPGIAKREQIRIRELKPTDESLESVFAYLVQR